MRMGLTLQVAPILDQRQEDIVTGAMRYWTEKPHQQVSIPMSVLALALEGNTAAPPNKKTPMSKNRGTFDVDFVLLTPEEMASLDPREKAGLSFGDCIFISESVSRDFVPLVAANLKMLGMLNDNNRVSRLIRASGVNIATERHWTANVLDISLAEKLFSEDPALFDAYMTWREEIERTDFFHDSTIDEILAQRLARLKRKRKKLPTPESTEMQPIVARQDAIHEKIALETKEKGE